MNTHMLLEWSSTPILTDFKGFLGVGRVRLPLLENNP
jgi:hypothetical protein